MEFNPWSADERLAAKQREFLKLVSKSYASGVQEAAAQLTGEAKRKPTPQERRRFIETYQRSFFTVRPASERGAL